MERPLGLRLQGRARSGSLSRLGRRALAMLSLIFRRKEADCLMRSQALERLLQVPITQATILTWTKPSRAIINQQLKTRLSPRNTWKRNSKSCGTSYTMSKAVRSFACKKHTTQPTQKSRHKRWALWQDSNELGRQVTHLQQESLSLATYTLQHRQLITYHPTLNSQGQGKASIIARTIR